MAQFFVCEPCGMSWSEPPLVRSDGAHTDWRGRLCFAIPQRAIPESMAHPTAAQFERAVLQREAMIASVEKMASRLQVAQVDVWRISGYSGRTLQRYVEAKRRADELEAMLAAADSRPHRMARLLLAVRLLLRALEESRCPSCERTHCATCGYMDGHRKTCRVVSAQRRIEALLD